MFGWKIKKVDAIYTKTCGSRSARQAAAEPLFDTGGQAFRGGEEPGFSTLVAGGRLIGTSAQTSEYSAFSIYQLCPWKECFIMNSKRNAFCMLILVFVIGMGSAVFAQPSFENNTPVGFSPADSTRQERFAAGDAVTVLVDLNEAANATYPVIGNFHKLEQSVPYFSAGSSTGNMSQDIDIFKFK